MARPNTLMRWFPAPPAPAVDSCLCPVHPRTLIAAVLGAAVRGALIERRGFASETPVFSALGLPWYSFSAL